MITKFIDTEDDVFSMQIFIRCGSINEKDDQSGISHFLEHIKFNKTNRSNKMNQEYFEAKQIGTTINAYTTNDYTTFFARSSFDIWKNVIKLLTSIVFDTDFSKNKIETERKVILEEKAMRHDVHTHLKHLDKLYLSKDNPYITKSIIGSKESLKRISNNEMKKYNDLYYAVDNCVFLFSCKKRHRDDIINFTMNSLKKIKSVKWETPTNTLTDDCIYKRYNYQLQVNSNPSLKYNKVLLYFRGISLTGEYIAYLPLINYVITEELYKQLREKNGYVYKIVCSHQPQIYVGISHITFTTTYHNISKLFKKIVFIIQKLKHDEKLFEAYKERYVNFYDNEISYNIEMLSVLMENVVFSKKNIKDTSMLRELFENFSYEHFKDILHFIFDVDVMSAMIISNKKPVDYHIKAFEKTLDSIRSTLKEKFE